MKFTYLVAGLIPLLISGCAAFSGKLPESFSVEHAGNIPKNITANEFNTFVAKSSYSKAMENSNIRNGSYPIHKEYNYSFMGTSNYGIQGMLSSSNCSFGNSNDACESANYFLPSTSFNQTLAIAKEYYTSGILRDISNFSAVKPKIEACQSNIKPTVKISDKTGILGDDIEKYFSASVKWNKSNMEDYIGSIYSTNFDCSQIKDSFDVSVKAKSVFVANRRADDTYRLTRLVSLPSYDIRSLSYQFFKNDYTISDKYVSVAMKYSQDSKGNITPKISLENLTSEFLELQGISVYYGSEIKEYLGAGDSHIDIAPESSSNIISNKLFILNGLGPIYVPITSLKDTMKIGLAIKYKIKSTNQIQTLYKTDILKIQTN